MRSARQPSEQERKELVRMTQQEIGRVALRAQMVLLSLRGFTAPDIADVQGISDVTVYKWLDRFDEEGPDGLYDRLRRGRPPKVDERVEEIIEEAMSKPPNEQGYNFTFWTVPLLTEHLHQTVEVNLSQETVRHALHDLGYRWRRPRWAVMREDPEKGERIRAIGKAILTASDETRVLIEDETVFKRLPPLRNMWMRKGEQVKVPTPSQNEDVCLYGVLQLQAGDSFHEFHDKGRSDHTIAYLENLMQHYPKRPILLVWDQATYHTSQAVQEWVDRHPRIRTLLLPKHAPELNPVEHIWRHLKDQVAANLNRSLEAIMDACHQFFQQNQPDDLLRMAGLALNT